MLVTKTNEEHYKAQNIPDTNTDMHGCFLLNGKPTIYVKHDSCVMNKIKSMLVVECMVISTIKPELFEKHKIPDK